MSVFRIQSNIASAQARQSLSRVGRAFNTDMNRLSSGSRITRAGDDAAGLAISNKFRADIRGLQAANRNANQALALVGIAEGAINSIVNLVERAKELAVAASSAQNEAQLNRLDDEYQQILEEIDRIVESTVYQGEPLIDGDFEGTFWVGPSGETYDSIDVDFSFDIDATGLSLDGTDLTDLTANPDVISDLDDALDLLNEALGLMGATTNRLEAAISNIEQTLVSYQNSESVIRDTDYAESISSFSSNSIVQQAATSMLAQANASQQLALSLLG